MTEHELVIATQAVLFFPPHGSSEAEQLAALRTMYRMAGWGTDPRLPAGD